tara:strand:+ start:342 stop:863 length:522 start_codon:yes stop_codon:yes gene_type:complete
MQSLEPAIEQGIPVPNVRQKLLPKLDEKSELMVRANTVKLLSDLTGNELVVTEENREQAKEALETTNNIQENLEKYPNETVAYLAGLVTTYDKMVVRDYADLKNFVVNKLIEESNGKNSKDRISALRALGDVDGVDAFKKRTEVTFAQKSTEDIEKELLEKLDSMTIDITPKK